MAVSQEQRMVLPRYQTQVQRRFLALVLAAGALGGCSSSGDPDADGSDVADPPGAAAPLSIGGRMGDAGDGPYETSINCAVALNITAERLMQMSSSASSNEVKLIARAEEHFKARAEQAQTDDPEITGSTAAAIARQRSEKSDAASEQAQLAIACLRRFGDEIDVG